MKSFQRTIDGVRYTARAEEELAGQVDGVFTLLEALDPGKLRNGFVISMPWAPLILAGDGEGYALTSPDFSRDPLAETTDDLSILLWVLVEQSRLLRQAGVDGAGVAFDDKVVMADGVLSEPDVYLERTADAPHGDSGWYVGPTDRRQVDEYRSCYAFELLRSRPGLIQALAFPPGFLLVFDGDSIKAILDPNDENLLST